MNWGIFEVNDLVHRGKEKGERLRDVAQLDQVEANLAKTVSSLKNYGCLRTRRKENSPSLFLLSPIPACQR